MTSPSGREGEESEGVAGSGDRSRYRYPQRHHHHHHQQQQQQRGQQQYRNQQEDKCCVVAVFGVASVAVVTMMLFCLSTRTTTTMMTTTTTATTMVSGFSRTTTLLSSRKRAFLVVREQGDVVQSVIERRIRQQHYSSDSAGSTGRLLAEDSTKLRRRGNSSSSSSSSAVVGQTRRRGEDTTDELGMSGVSIMSKQPTTMTAAAFSMTTTTTSRSRSDSNCGGSISRKGSDGKSNKFSRRDDEQGRNKDNRENDETASSSSAFEGLTGGSSLLHDLSKTSATDLFVSAAAERLEKLLSLTTTTVNNDSDSNADPVSNSVSSSTAAAAEKGQKRKRIEKDNMRYGTTTTTSPPGVNTNNNVAAIASKRKGKKNEDKEVHRSFSSSSSSTSSRTGTNNNNITTTEATTRVVQTTGATTTTTKTYQQHKPASLKATSSTTKPLSSSSSLAAVATTGSISSSIQENVEYDFDIQLTDEERELFNMLKDVCNELQLSTTLRVAGGWVRDKLLQSESFVKSMYVGGSTSFEDEMLESITTSSKAKVRATSRLTSKFRNPTSTSQPWRRQQRQQQQQGQGQQPGGQRGGCQNSNKQQQEQQPVDIDIALDDMLGREFADNINRYLSVKECGDLDNQDDPAQCHYKPISVGVVVKNPEKSKHLETATMRINTFWIDFVNLRTEEYANDASDYQEQHDETSGGATATATSGSRIPETMSIGTAYEDAYRRDLTINSLFYNVNTGLVEDWTNSGIQDLRRGIISTPLHPLTTLLDDPLRVLRSVRFAARLRFSIDDNLQKAAIDKRVHYALNLKVSRERIGNEIDLMLRSPDPVGAMRLLINLRLVNTVLPVDKHIMNMIIGNNGDAGITHGVNKEDATAATVIAATKLLSTGLHLLSTSYEHMIDCRSTTPLWMGGSCDSSGQHGSNNNNSEHHDDEVDNNNVLSFGFGYYYYYDDDEVDIGLLDDLETRRLLWYASFLKPIEDYQNRIQDRETGQQQEQHQQERQSPTKQQQQSSNRSKKKKKRTSILTRLLVDDLKRPVRDAEAIQKIVIAADEITTYLKGGADVSATMILLNEIRITYGYNQQQDQDTNDDSCAVTMADHDDDDSDVEMMGRDKRHRLDVVCSMNGRIVDSIVEEDLVWHHAMEFRSTCYDIISRVGPLWKAAMFLSLSEELAKIGTTTNNNAGSSMMFEYAIEGDIIDEARNEQRRGVVERYDIFATTIQQLGLVGIWNEKPLLDGDEIRRGQLLPNIPKGPEFRIVMDEQQRWMITHPGADAIALGQHLLQQFPQYTVAAAAEMVENTNSQAVRGER